MRVAVTTPSIRDFYFTPRRDAALGARVLERELRKSEIDASVSVFSSGRAHSVGLPDELDYLRRYMVPGETGPASWFGRYRRFGSDPASAADRLVAGHPDFVFISSFAWGYSDEALALARELRSRRPELPIVIGGHGPTVHPETFLSAVDSAGSPLFTLVAAGEAEGHIEQLFDSISKSDRFIDLRAGRQAQPEPVCAAPERPRGRLSMMLTRGCPCQCDFCANHIAHGQGLRTSPPGRWLRCLESAVNVSESVLVNVEDDNILYLKGEFFQFLADVRSRFPKARFAAENGLDYRRLDAADIDVLSDAGFTEINLSLGTSFLNNASDSREANRRRYESIVIRAAEVGLPVTTHFICGSARDTPGETSATLRYLADLPTRIGISSFYPIPGIAGFEAPDRFRGLPPRLALGSSVYPWTGTVDTGSMITAFRLARILNLRRRTLTGGPVDATGEELLARISRSRRIHTLVRNRGGVTIRQVPNLNDELAGEVLACLG